MVGALRAGEDLAGQIIATSELFYNRKTQLRYLFALKNVIGAQIKQLHKAQIEEEGKRQ